MTSFPEQLGVALRALRKARGLSVVAIEKRTGLHGQTLAAYESGRRGLLSDTLGRLLDAMGANLYDFQQALDRARAGFDTVPETEPAAHSASLIGDAATLALALQLMRERNGLALDQLAKGLEVKPATVYRYEEERAIRLTTLDRLLDTYRASWLDLHEALVVASFLRPWRKAEAPSSSARLRMALLCLGHPHAPAQIESQHLTRLENLLDELSEQDPARS